jgi:peptidyl-dipeptidase A
MTPDYLAEVGLIESAGKNREADINVDEWRWKVFSGEVTPDNYNQAWWDLREQYQGVAPPVERSEADFDPGAKYHIPGNVSYTRYFLARILQFQLQRTLCEIAGHDGELQACSLYGSKEAGERFWALLEKGESQPWQDTLEEFAGTREMDATAIIDYFAPLMEYLKEQNEGRSCGW